MDDLQEKKGDLKFISVIHLWKKIWNIPFFQCNLSDLRGKNLDPHLNKKHVYPLSFNDSLVDLATLIQSLLSYLD